MAVSCALAFLLWLGHRGWRLYHHGHWSQYPHGVFPPVSTHCDGVWVGTWGDRWRLFGWLRGCYPRCAVPGDAHGSRRTTGCRAARGDPGQQRDGAGNLDSSPMAPVPHLRYPRGRGQRVCQLYRPLLISAALVCTQAGPRHWHSVLRCRHGVDSAVALVATPHRPNGMAVCLLVAGRVAPRDAAAAQPYLAATTS